MRSVWSTDNEHFYCSISTINNKYSIFVLLKKKKKTAAKVVYSAFVYRKCELTDWFKSKEHWGVMDHKTHSSSHGFWSLIGYFFQYANKQTTTATKSMLTIYYMEPFKQGTLAHSLKWKNYIE